MAWFAGGLSGVDGLTPHGFCLSWDPGLLWLQAGSDTLIALAYYSIPIALMQFARKREDLAFPWLFRLFACFILACGTTHVLGVVTLWKPFYWLDGGLKGLTALLSVVTAVLLWPLIPRALALPSPTQLHILNEALSRQIAETEAIAADLRTSEDSLRQAQKMEAVGQLTGGIAHDFNNMLTAVIGSMELLQRRLPAADDSSQRLVNNAMQGALRAAKLTSQLLSFSPAPTVGFTGGRCGGCGGANA